MAVFITYEILQGLHLSEPELKLEIAVFLSSKRKFL
jgi:predicted nucleic acid-binding protein